MKKLFRILTLLLLISFISPHGYSSEIVRVKNIKSDKPIYRPNVTEVLELIEEEGDEEYWYGIYLNNEKIGWVNITFKISHEINSYIPDSSQDYWNVIDIRLYKDHKDKLLKYYSHNN